MNTRANNILDNPSDSSALNDTSTQPTTNEPMPVSDFRSHVSSMFAAAEARLMAAHNYIAQHVDERMSHHFDASLAAAGEMGNDSTEEREQLKQAIRDDFAVRQRRLTERLAESMQGLALHDVGAAVLVMDGASEAAANALRKHSGTKTIDIETPPSDVDNLPRQKSPLA